MIELPARECTREELIAEICRLNYELGKAQGELEGLRLWGARLARRVGSDRAINRHGRDRAPERNPEQERNGSG